MKIKEDISDLTSLIKTQWGIELQVIQQKYLDRINSIPDLLKDKDFRAFGIRFEMIFLFI